MIKALRQLALSALNAAGTPAANAISPHAVSLAGRLMMAIIADNGISHELQPYWANRKIGLWSPPGNATSVNTLGYGTPSATGTATARNVAATNLFTRMRRLGYVSAATAGSLAAIRQTANQITIGNGSGLGGFVKAIRFGCSDAATVNGARQFVGVISSTAAPTNVEPSTLINCIGVGHGAADTNLKIFHGGSVAQTPIDLGANFPANTLSVDLYELLLYASPMLNDSVGYRVTRLNTGDVASGVLTAAAPGTQLPSSGTLLNYLMAWRSNNATALAVGLDIASDYIETAA